MTYRSRYRRNGRPTLRPGAGARFSVDEGNKFVFDFQTYDDRSSEGNGLTYRITGGEDADRFVIDPITGKLYFAETPDYENPLDQGRNNSYSVRVRVTDASGAFDDDGYTVHVRNRNEPSNRRPTLVPGALTRFNVDENTTHVFDFSTNDDNSSEGNGLTYRITGGADADLFVIDAVTGKLSFAEAPDFENPLDHDRNNSYAVRVRVTDTQGAYDDDGYTVHVNNVVDEGPVGPNEIVGTADGEFLAGTDGDDSIVGLGGSDNIAAGIGDDTLSGVDAKDNRGTGEIDLLIGGPGADTFVLGDGEGAYYLDPVRTDFGFTSFAIVDDFSAGTDSVILSGSTEYTISADGGDSFLLAGNFVDGSADAIAKFNGVQLSDADLKGGSFMFV